MLFSFLNSLFSLLQKLFFSPLFVLFGRQIKIEIKLKIIILIIFKFPVKENFIQCLFLLFLSDVIET